MRSLSHRRPARSTLSGVAEFCHHAKGKGLVLIVIPFGSREGPTLTRSSPDAESAAQGDPAAQVRSRAHMPQPAVADKIDLQPFVDKRARALA